ncbi:alanine racemase [Helicobacter sp. 12S02634-8]|uniref:alanine racemase n=1 Tax=Helicobacter sp. 12S02634-8 TaxID=1476199 RepID=UPI000BA71515|nr:alanine racemase [Helicobacter sp. 12S02634-8]PAF47064.1 alanine racemase [Helicobacter sp. 12S02634-8]
MFANNKKLALMALCIGSLALSAPVLNYPYAVTRSNVNAYLEIDPQILKNNIQIIKKTLDGKSKICAVLKANAYGSSIQNILSILTEEKIPCIAITSNEEIKKLRHLKYNGQILRIRTATMGEIKDAIPYRVTETLGNLTQAQALNALAQKEHKTLPIHINLNSAGMDRNGVDMSSKEGKDIAVKIATLPHLKVEGIMTHFPMEDIPSIQAGLAQFKKDSAYLIKAAHLNAKNITLHTANSIATIEVPASRLDMVRPGMLIYGDKAFEKYGIKQSMRFISAVAAINTYPKGSKVGYDGTYTLSRDSRLANIPIGYSDGYPRSLSNKGQVLINGHKVPIVGRISMNTFMVDVTDFPDIKANNPVVLFGKQCGNEITEEDIAQNTQTIFAETMVIWGNSNPIFIKDSAQNEVCP